MGTEWVYRSHARELLTRAAADHDTRPATAAEMVLACRDISLCMPLNTTAAGLYMRLWRQAFPDHSVDGIDHRPHHCANRGYGVWDCPGFG